MPSHLHGIKVHGKIARSIAHNHLNFVYFYQTLLLLEMGCSQSKDACECKRHGSGEMKKCEHGMSAEKCQTCAPHMKDGDTGMP